MYSSHLSGRRDMPLAYLNAVCSGRVREEALSQLTAVQREQLAERLGVDTSFIGQIEAVNINKAISLDTLFRISKALEIPPCKLLDFD